MQKYFKTELIEKFIEGKGWSVRKFCAECKITMLTYMKILNQQLDFKSSALYKIAKIMNLEMCNLCC